MSSLTHVLYCIELVALNRHHYIHVRVLTRAQRLGFLSPSTPSLLELCGQADVYSTFPLSLAAKIICIVSSQSSQIQSI